MRSPPAEKLHLTPGMRILDLGCGTALSSIFLAREFGVQVWAEHLWVAATDNWGRIRDAGLRDRVFHLHVEAHSLRFADDFFDALVSLDAHHYFGTDDLYLSYCARFVRPGGELGIVCPGVREGLATGLPAHLQPTWLPEFWSFHRPAWWRTHLERSGLVNVATADLIPDGWRQWLTWLEVCGDFGYPTDVAQAAMLRLDAGCTLGFSRIVARRRASP